jgi:hypothetical protein
LALCVCSFIGKFLVMQAEHTVASYNRIEFTSKIATVYLWFMKKYKMGFVLWITFPRKTHWSWKILKFFL